MKKIFISLLCLTSGVINTEKPLSFVDKSIDAFINHVVENERDKQSFKMYYARLQEKVATSDPSKQRATRQYLYHIAFNNLEKKHKDWRQQIDVFFSDVHFTVDESFDEVRGNIRHFLVWYGAYEEYLAVKMLAEQKNNKPDKEAITIKAEQPQKSDDEVSLSFLKKIKSYASGLGNKIANWFGYTKKTQLA